MAMQSIRTNTEEAHAGSDRPCAATAKPPARGQFNLFTGELEPFSDRPAALPEEAWLFDPDFGLVLPDDPAGKEVLVATEACCDSVQGLGTGGSG